MLTRDPGRRRQKLAKNLEKLQQRRTDLAEQSAQAHADWQAALESGTDTARLTERRRALATALSDVEAEVGTVAGWIDEIDTAEAAAAEAERLERERREALAKLESGTARLTELRRTEAAALAEAFETMRTAAEKYCLHQTEAIELQRSMGLLAEELDIPWQAPEAAPMPPRDAPAENLALARIAFAVPRGVGAVITEVAAAVAMGVRPDQPSEAARTAVVGMVKQP